MSLIIGFLTFFLVLDCIILVFLVLLQLPKKEAGIGVAFGGGATDALFGAGSGNVLTKITKWTSGIFFTLCLVLAVMTGHQARQTNASALSEELANRPKSTPSSLNTGLLSNTPTAAPPPEATPVKPVPSSGIGGDNPPTATGTSKTSPTPPAKPSTPAPSPTPKPK